MNVNNLLSLNLGKFWKDLDIDNACKLAAGKTSTLFSLYNADVPVILKVYINPDIHKLEFEQAVLKYLANCKLSYYTPTPVRTDDGEFFVKIHDVDRLLVLTLLPKFTSHPANRDNRNEVAAAGGALGELHAALKSCTLRQIDEQLPPWGSLNAIHPLVKKPEEIPTIIGLKGQQHTELTKLLHELSSTSAGLYSSLPLQVIHGDYISLNVLTDKSHVRAVIDFEYARHDLRLMDYVCGLDDFCRFPWKNEDKWDYVEAFCMRYAQYAALATIEIDQFLTVLKLRKASSIVYWTGWFMEGKSPINKLIDAASEIHSMERWLEANGATLVDIIQQSNN